VPPLEGAGVDVDAEPGELRQIGPALLDLFVF
jgi:hypothetical protein